jgi:hypothetical protein
MKNTILYIIQKTIVTYAALSKRHFGFSLSFLLLFTALSAGIAFVYCSVFDLFTHDEFNGATLAERLDDVIFTYKWMEVSSFLLVISFGVYASYIRNFLPDEREWPSLKKMFKNLNPLTWKALFISIVAYLFVYLFTYADYFQPEYMPHGPLGVFNTYDMHNVPLSSREMAFQRWLAYLVYFVKAYLPFVLAFCITLASMSGQFNRKLLYKFRKELLLILVFAFVFNTLSTSTRAYIDHYLLELLVIVFPDSFIDAGFRISVYAVIQAWFFLAFGCLLVYPIQARMKDLDAVPEAEPETQS